MKKHTFVILAYHESDDLEECIKSVLKQSVKSNVLIATSTPNDYIMDLASQYSLGVMVNKEESNKGSDYNFAIKTMDSELITIAHQDDLYNRNYTKEILKKYVSVYASNNPNEACSEIFCGLLSGKKYPKEVIDILEHYKATKPNL